MVIGKGISGRVEGRYTFDCLRAGPGEEGPWESRQPLASAPTAFQEQAIPKVKYIF